MCFYVFSLPYPPARPLPKTVGASLLPATLYIMYVCVHAAWFDYEDKAHVCHTEYEGGPSFTPRCSLNCRLHWKGLRRSLA